jgi:hypothetical protein
LRGAASLRTAFEAARNALRNKEQRAGITPSMPQASFGADIEHRLANMVPGGESGESGRAKP